MSLVWLPFQKTVHLTVIDTNKYMDQLYEKTQMREPTVTQSYLDHFDIIEKLCSLLEMDITNSFCSKHVQLLVLAKTLTNK